MKIFVKNGALTDMHWIDDAIQVDTPEEADVILFTGGSDVTPSFYGEARGSYTGPCDLARDKEERELFKTYVGKKQFIGICRGLN